MEAPVRTARQAHLWPAVPRQLLLLALQLLLLLLPLLVARNGPVSVLASLERDDSRGQREDEFRSASSSRRQLVQRQRRQLLQEQQQVEGRAVQPQFVPFSMAEQQHQLQVGGAYPSDLCGVWQRNYTRLHALIRMRSASAAATGVGRANGSNGGDPPVRFLTFVTHYSDCGGLGDALVGLATAFIVALLDRRAFLIGHRCFAYAFNPAFIDWRVSPDVPMEHMVDGMAAMRRGKGRRKRRMRRRGGKGIGGGAEGEGEGGEEVVFLDLLNKEVKDFEGFFGQWRDVANVQVQWNRGRVTRMLRGVGVKGEWKRRLKETGLRIPYAFGCILRYILRPRMEVSRLVSRLHRRVTATHTSALGLHLRVPDHVAWKGTNAASEMRWRKGQRGAAADASRLVACAQAVEEFWLPPSLQVVWLFMTNSEHLKSQVEQQYPSKVLVTDNPPVHSRLVANESLRREAFVSVVAEWLLFSSCCERYVVSAASGFSKTAVLYGMKPDRLYVSSQCSPDKPMSVLQLGDSWSGI